MEEMQGAEIRVCVNARAFRQGMASAVPQLVHLQSGFSR
jgi:hypothetical protein